ncbi:hypothetical protein PR048_015359 [Dryococelus australis]|uniref:Uncharacterized protein n=1 Tax=Dryococelus australis TaxID=614101 RepID=A0ABQ9HGQ7_9NEOP|nr:hypothetical protein PR048_015359 [Dryococelus australis]
MALKTIPVYQIPAHKSFSFEGEDWEIWKYRFARFSCAPGLSNEKEGTHVNALVYLMGDKAELILQFQQEGESFEAFINNLHTISKNYDFPPTYKNEAIGDQTVISIERSLSEKLQLSLTRH